MELLYYVNNNFVHNFSQISNNIFRYEIMKKLLLIVFLCINIVLCTSVGEIPTAWADKILVLTFTFNDKEYVFDAQDVRMDNFYFESIRQKRELNSSINRANTLNKLLNMGIEPEVALEYCFAGFSNFLKRMREDLECEPKDASYQFVPNPPHFLFTHEKIGYKLDILSLANQIILALNNNNTIIKLTPQELLPSVFYDDIKDYCSVRANFSTSFLDNENREHNMNLALNKLDGLVIQPDIEYSFNSLTGIRTESRGYKPSKIIVGGKYVEGTGGGVCQVSTTLYNALLLAGVDITEVHNHTLMSSYVKLGFDAMVNYGLADLKWKSNLNFPLFISAGIINNSIKITVWGKPYRNGERFERVVEIEQEYEAPEDEIIEDKMGEYTDIVEFDGDEAYIQYPHKGYKVRSILECYRFDKLVERKLIRRCVYKPCAGIKVVGTKKRLFDGSYGN